MFERYTEKARRTLFFARYEADVLDSPHIEPGHLLLGLLREDEALTKRFLLSHISPQSIRKQIESDMSARDREASSRDVKLKLSNGGRRVLVYASEEAERLSNKHIGTEHLLLGLLTEYDGNGAAKLLKEAGVQLASVREELARTPHHDNEQMTEGDPVTEPDSELKDVAEVQSLIRSIVRRMEEAIAKLDFKKAQECASEERKERKNLRNLCKQHGLDL
jgi:ATP-dependent Clp protease ATP-binding subunit ClpC